MAEPLLDVLKVGLKEAHGSEEFCDCKIICGPYQFNVHKVILATQSDYFKVAFKKGTFKEGETGVIELKALPSDKNDQGDADEECDDPEIIKLMISSFYHLEYSCDTFLPTDQTSKLNASAAQTLSGSVPSVLTHAKVFAAAVKYQADGLRDLAAEKFENTIRFFWDDEVFAEVVTVVFHSTPEGVLTLRNIVIDTLYSHLDALKDKKEIQAVLCEIPRLAYILLKRKCDEGSLKATRPSPSDVDYTETRLCLRLLGAKVTLGLGTESAVVELKNNIWRWQCLLKRNEKTTGMIGVGAESRV